MSYEQQIASAGVVVRGLRYKARWMQYTVRCLVIAMVISLALALVIPVLNALVR